MSLRQKGCLTWSDDCYRLVGFDCWQSSLRPQTGQHKQREHSGTTQYAYWHARVLRPSFVPPRYLAQLALRTNHKCEQLTDCSAADRTPSDISVEAVLRPSIITLIREDILPESNFSVAIGARRFDPPGNLDSSRASSWARREHVRRLRNLGETQESPERHSQLLVMQAQEGAVRLQIGC
jgi:hypothetical protein